MEIMLITFLQGQGYYAAYYILQNHRVSGLCPSSGILNNGKHNVSETGSVSVLR
jgi:hypothetical protein